ncbi:amino acid permease [Ferruginibacter lapsinanis]|uniref:amino acid permease n=1 Tax=Ferruginibacter lapsinanis TaxID=563172 RepID=UPI001E50B01F|nr:amino acid permease [Ferruginibacter lapsinanis]UEG49188.1 amino acid permease [Ferruginibacter lapsinanis]
MSNSLFRTKKIENILAEGGDDPHGGDGLKRVLTVRDLTFFGIAAILGAGSFSSLGGAVFNGGPGVVILFLITAVACAFTAFCYSEFASRIPVAGSAYTYAYASFGELFAWIIGWALIMEYSIGNIYVAFSWSDYFTSFLSKCGVDLPTWLATSYKEAQHAVRDGALTGDQFEAWKTAPVIGGLRIIFDLPAVIINFLITYLVYRGIKESRNFSNVMVILKMVVVGMVIVVGGYLVFANGLTFNWTPANDAGVRSFMPNGFSGVMAAVAGVFFAYIGFDAVSVLAEESKNPQRDLPRGMIYSLVICTIVYILLTLVLTGAVNYRNFDGVGDPLAFIFEKQNLNVGWMQLFVAVAAVVAMTSVLLVFQMGQPRIWMSMSRDGLLPSVFQKIHPTYKTPSFATIVTGLVVGIPILFTDKTFVLDFTSIATLFAFVLVCGGVLLIPRKEKQSGKFNIPYINGKIIFPFIIIGSIAVLVYMIPKYFTDKIDFTEEKKIDAFAAVIPKHNFDTVMVLQQLQQHLSIAADHDELFTGLSDSIAVKQSAAEKISVANKFIASSDTEQSRTQKVSTVIFWLLMIGLAIITIVKNYSLIPLMGVSTCLYLLTGMTKANWLWFGGWLLLGLIVYFMYGYKKSKLAK